MVVPLLVGLEDVRLRRIANRRYKVSVRAMATPIDQYKKESVNASNGTA